jgi:hypothetical protein
MLETSHNFYSMIQSSDNILLHKSDLGKSKPGIHRLPPSSFAYGKTTGEDKEGAGSLISNWKEHQSSSKLESEQDYRQLNSLSVVKGLSTATEFRNYRKGKDVRIHSSQQGLKRNPSNPDMTYGLALPNATSIKAVIHNFYGRLALDSLHDCYSKTPLLKPKKYSTNKAFELLKTARLQEKPTRSEFKMRKFKRVSSRTDCWRDCKKKSEKNSN